VSAFGSRSGKDAGRLDDAATDDDGVQTTEPDADTALTPCWLLASDLTPRSSAAIAMQTKAARTAETLAAPSFAMVRRKAVCALIMSVAKLELASLTASAARPRTKKGDPIVPKGYSKANVSKELLLSGDGRVGHSGGLSPLLPMRASYEGEGEG